MNFWEEIILPAIEVWINAIPKALNEFLNTIINIPKEDPWLIIVLIATIIVLLLFKNRQRIKLRIRKIFKE